MPQSKIGKNPYFSMRARQEDIDHFLSVRDKTGLSSADILHVALIGLEDRIVQHIQNVIHDLNTDH